jgi:hypothetical protein
MKRKISTNKRDTVLVLFYFNLIFCNHYQFTCFVTLYEGGKVGATNKREPKKNDKWGGIVGATNKWPHLFKGVFGCEKKVKG